MRYYAERWGRNPHQVKRQIRQESSFDPHAVSPAGAQGLAQFMPATWGDLERKGRSPFDPEAAIEQLCAFMHLLQQAHGSLARALAAYNWGPGHVRRLGNAPDWFAQCPAETRAYVESCLDFAGEALQTG